MGESPTIAELEDIVSEINQEMYKATDCEYIYLRCISNGWMQLVELNSVPIWDTESDDREYISDTDQQEDIKTHIRKVLIAEISKLAKVLPVLKEGL